MRTSDAQSSWPLRKRHAPGGAPLPMKKTLEAQLYTESGEIEAEKTTTNILCHNVFLKLSSDIWTKHHLTPSSQTLSLMAF
jgi:hypothetical protein